MKNRYFDSVVEHYENCWDSNPNLFLWDKGPIEKLPYEFRVLEFAPNKSRSMWTYATCGMSDFDTPKPIELHIFSSKKDEGIIELLTAVTYYHRNTSNVDLNYTINFGKPWQDNSQCEHGFLSLPYLDGPTLENLRVGDDCIKFYWLIPITTKELEYKKKYGVDALEKKFDNASFNYIDAKRKSAV